MSPRLLVTRPRAQAAGWVSALRAAGVDAHVLPLIDIAPVATPDLLRAAWAALPEIDLAVFVSANAVEHFFAERPKGGTWPAHARAATTGGGTAAALHRAGVPLAQIVVPAAGQVQESESLWQRLQSDPWSQRRVLVVRGEDGRDWLAERLLHAGARVEFVAAYRRLPPQLRAEEQALLAQALAEPAQHLWLFSSGLAVRHLTGLAPGGPGRCAGALCTHERIAQLALEVGFARLRVVQPEPQAPAPSIAQAIAFLQSDSS